MLGIKKMKDLFIFDSNNIYIKKVNNDIEHNSESLSQW